MIKIRYESPQQVRAELKEYKGVSGIYVVSFKEGSEENYVGQGKDLYDRVSKHIGNMNVKNKGIGSPAHLKEREMYEEYGTYTITIYAAPYQELNWYKEFCSWYFGSFSHSKFSRRDRDVVTPYLCKDFEWITREMLDKFDMPCIPYVEQKDPQLEVFKMLVKQSKNKKNKEVDYGF